MARSLTHDLMTFAKNLWKRLKRVITLRETPMAALHGVAEDIHKLRHGVKKSRRSGDEKDARRMLEKGRRAYNEKRYTEAEGYLIRALEFDERMPWAHCFLGHTAYQMGKLEEAAAHWHRAVVCDPQSDAAAKARKKIEGLSAKRRETLQEMEMHVRESSRAPVDS